MRCSRRQVADENTKKTDKSAQDAKHDGDCCIWKYLAKSQLKLYMYTEKGLKGGTASGITIYNKTKGRLNNCACCYDI
jgi:hypothetical protein